MLKLKNFGLLSAYYDVLDQFLPGFEHIPPTPIDRIDYGLQQQGEGLYVMDYILNMCNLFIAVHKLLS